MSVPYEAYIHYTGDVQIKVNGTIFFDFEDLYPELDNYDIVLEDNETTLIVGAMSPNQYKQLLLANILED